MISKNEWKKIWKEKFVSGLVKLISEICAERLKKTPINSIRRVNPEARIRT
jgi:hypothetical protein